MDWFNPAVIISALTFFWTTWQLVTKMFGSPSGRTVLAFVAYMAVSLVFGLYVLHVHLHEQGSPLHTGLAGMIVAIFIGGSALILLFIGKLLNIARP